MLLALLCLPSCRAEGNAGAASTGGAADGVVTQIARLEPATAVPPAASATAAAAVAGVAEPGSPVPATDSSTFCREVERQARQTNQSLPQKLDDDTRATRIAAHGCNVILEYAVRDLSQEQVAAEGMRAMRSAVLAKLCADGGARGVMAHGGSFTSVYRDDAEALIDQFTIGAEDCAELAPPTL